MNGWVLSYVLAGSGLIGLYSAGEAFGWEIESGARSVIAPNVRQSPGGWRSWTFWHQGIHGGK